VLRHDLQRLPFSARIDYPQDKISTVDNGSSYIDREGLASFHTGRPPRNKGRRYPPDPPTVQEICAVMCAAGDDPDGLRLRGLIVALWRAQVCGSARRLRSSRATWTRCVVRSSFVAAKAANAARSAWTAGPGSS
jgi:hypothetical protein